ncbi:MAG: PEGA domain-containing protein [Phenylobacterium sp.]|uniref:PEGA domain-containing protein n=2 Tax=Brevundimonas TaxID=41275 RepID=A0AB37EC53_9CAUL|nr:MULTISPECIES: PEGA domain-containing protein [Brevundimonas]MDZ4376170.1 PEGA domain-containing protein [Phenylobacterium sp.]QIH74555.1 PEGA domain-containing protein [Brevundimonas mediterranea]TAJ53687.1 MAG: PEGA domain-containing protein [Brevundimonas sp.]
MLAGVAMSLPACATVTRGSSQQFSVQSTPPGAQVSTSNGFECQATPCTFRMSRKDAFRITVSKDGYVAQTHDITSSVSGAGGTAMAGNILIGGIIGGAIDATSGAMNDLKPNPLIVTLRTPAEEAAAAQAPVATPPAAAAAGGE